MKQLIAVPIATLSPSTNVAEPSAGETLWVSGGTYTTGQYRIRTQTHRIYKALQDHSGRAAAPESDPLYWYDWGPTNWGAMFDDEINTQSTRADNITLTLSGMFNACGLYGVDCASVSYSYTSAIDGVSIGPVTVPMSDPPLDWYDWAFGPDRVIDTLMIESLPPCTDGALSVTLAATGGTAALGFVAAGDFRDWLDGAQWGGVQVDASASTVDNTAYVKRSDGKNRAVLNPNSTDMTVSVIGERLVVDGAWNVVRRTLGIPSGFSATTRAGFSGLNVFGRPSARITYGPTKAVIEMTVKGVT